jgi:hypothetical protein
MIRINNSALKPKLGHGKQYRKTSFQMENKHKLKKQNIKIVKLINKNNRFQYKNSKVMPT